jgi:hypothetical protein
MVQKPAFSALIKASVDKFDMRHRHFMLGKALKRIDEDHKGVKWYFLCTSLCFYGTHVAQSAERL